MTENFDYHGEAEELLKRAIRQFAAWASANWMTNETEAQTLADPTASPKEYARGYNDGIASIGDAAEAWIEDGCHG